MKNPYGNLGWALSPLDGKAALVKDHLNAAAVEDETLSRWEEQFSNKSWGCACRKSGLVVIDVDPRNGGTVKAVEETFGKLPETAVQITGSGGLHIVFRRPNVSSLRTKKLPPGVDVLADGSYFVVSPSPGYSWQVSPHEKLADLPYTVLEFLERNESTKAGSDNFDDLYVECGDRFFTLQKIAGKLRNMGFGEEAMRASLQALFDHQFEKDSADYEEKIRDLAAWAATLPSELNIVAEVEYKGKTYTVKGKNVKEALANGAKFVRRV